MKLSRAVVLVCLAVGLGAGAPAHADLKGAFDGLFSGSNVTATKPGRFSGSVRSGFTGGSIDIRFPQHPTTGLISIDPPRMPTASCSGISAHFGGFSFISGNQIEGMIQNIANGAKGFVINMAMKTLCPMCENVISQMTALAQQASKMAVDSCKIGENLAQMAWEKGGLPAESEPQRWTGLCARSQVSGGAGGASDYLSAISDVCANAKDAMQRIDGWIKQLEGQAKNEREKAAIKEEVGAPGNRTWIHLMALDLPGDEKTNKHWRELLLNMLGTQITDKDGNTTPYLPTLVVKSASSNPITKNLFKSFICGNKPSEDAGRHADWYANANRHCEDLHRSMRTQITQSYYVCPDSDKDCLGMQKVEFSSADSIFTGSGFLYHVIEVLRQAVEAVVQDDANFYTSEKGRRFIAMANMVPFPLYQAVNIAAVNPTGGASLIQTLAIPIAEAMAIEYFDSIMLSVAQASRGAGTDLKMMEQVSAVMAGARASMDAGREALSKSFYLQQAILEQIRVANLSVQREVMTPELIGASRYAEYINTLKNTAPSGSSASESQQTQ